MKEINEEKVVKSEVVKEIFKWMDKKCKDQKKRVEKAEEESKRARRNCYFEDEICIIESAETDVEREKARLNAFVEVKIGIEKYMRKCRHEEAEKRDKS